jgi:hypothetical protein
MGVKERKEREKEDLRRAILEVAHEMFKRSSKFTMNRMTRLHP